MIKKKRIGKKFTALIITGLVFLLITSLHLLGVFSYLENRSYDMRVRFWANTSFSIPSHDLVVIQLDQDSLDWAQKERGWGWPWPRQAYAEIIDYMNLSGAKSVAFDVIFSEPSIYSRFIEDDTIFARACEDYGKVVQAVMFSQQTGTILSLPQDLNVPLFHPENFDIFLDKFKISADMRGQFPIKELRETAGALGSVTGVTDTDGIIRRVQPFTIFDNKAIPALSTASLLVAGYDGHIYYNQKNSSLEWGNFSIPVDKNGFTLLRFKGLLDRYIPYSAKDILLSAESRARGEELESGLYETAMGTIWAKYTPENFTDTHVFFGYNAPGLYDIFSSPISPLYQGVGFHITMLDNLLQGDFIKESSQWVNLILLLAVVILIVCLSMFFSRIIVSVGGTIVIVVLTVIGVFAAYQFGGLWIPMIIYLAAALASFLTVTLYNYATEGSQKRFIKSAFSQYLSPKVIEQIIHDPSQLKLGGEKREMTAIFTDVRAFSTISEALGDPTKLVELLNFYLTRMSNIVLDNQGTIDKYEGDAIIAFFGAPVYMSNHASLACRAVVQMKKAETQINREALSLGLITPEVMQAMAKKGVIKNIDDPNPIFTRIGMNTGDMVVGNMGTPNKMDYTIMGNAVNLAARLEGVNKQYDTGGILISEYTRAFIGDEFTMRPLSRVRVVGINTPLRLYELLDIASEASPEILNMVKNWEQAFNSYEKQDFIAAKNIFQTIYDTNNTDMTAKKYLNRCIDYIASPPDTKMWDEGVDNLTQK